MLSKEEAKQLRIDFWSKLSDQMEKMKNPFGSKVNWMNYNTGFNHLYFRMEADEEGCRLCIDIQFPDPGVREVFYEQFQEFSNILEGKFKDLKWYPTFEHWNGKEISRIAIEKNDCNLNRREDWDKMHLFLKLNFAKLDAFWCEFDEVFKGLK
ncbi:DUF4268 domain-containing protein [Paracrocinitomix mangrovi]|uniref:DUF4268 domain-containing protein n=1 Tax=Paracrocinitomix mangrovi TaxID=2862509 RepID=UPI001C8D21D8|nr:DUF4268 domain-containing protein [Paracrocinitomix mangrovi]UKN02397.1 DUF4268 domain-containing protein [Paracrocinitomix mangrovi]